MNKTAIANIGLKVLGVGRIDSIDASDDVSTSCRESIDIAIGDYAQAVKTNAMITRQALVRSGSPVDGYLYSYTTPTVPPVLRNLRLASNLKFYPEGGLIHTDDPEAVMVYVKGGFDVADLPTYAAKAIGFGLAVLIAADVGKDDRLPTADALYDRAIRTAKMIEGQSNNPPTASPLWGAPK